MNRARAFTLVEVILASLIGSLVLIAAVGVYATLSATDTRHRARTIQTTEISLGYRVLERCFQLLVMEEAAPVADAEARQRIDRDLQRADGLLADDDGADLERARLLLIPDATAPAAMRGPNGPVRPQMFRLALRSPPIAGGFQPSDPAAISRAAFVQSRPSDRDRRSSRRESRRSIDPAGDTEDEWDADNSAAARAPGVRAELILLPDDRQPESDPVARSAVTIAGGLAGFTPALEPTDEIGWTLWYREIPARTGADDLTLEERRRVLEGDTSFLEREIDPGDLAYQPDPASFRRIPLISGIRYMEWQVYRRARFVNQIAALAARELPAYVEVSFELLNGRRENWMFEVAWSTGPEPGALLAQGADPLDLLVDPTQPVLDENGNPVPGSPTDGGAGGGTGGGGAGGPVAGTPGQPTTGGGKPAGPTKPSKPTTAPTRPGTNTPAQPNQGGGSGGNPNANPNTGGGNTNAPAVPPRRNAPARPDPNRPQAERPAGQRGN